MAGCWPCWEGVAKSWELEIMRSAIRLLDVDIVTILETMMGVMQFVDLDTAETIVDSFHQDKNRNDQDLRFIANKEYTDIYLPLLNQGYIPTRNY